MGPGNKYFLLGGLAGGTFAALCFFLFLDQSREATTRSVAMGPLPAVRAGPIVSVDPGPRQVLSKDSFGRAGGALYPRETIESPSSLKSGGRTSDTEELLRPSNFSRDSSRGRFDPRFSLDPARTGQTVGQGRETLTESNQGLAPPTGSHSEGEGNSQMSMAELRKTMPSTVVCPKNPEEYGSVAKNMECKKRLPNVIGIGVEKCGTAAISFFLQNHPFLVHADPMEVFFWNRHLQEGLDWYRNRMPVSSKYQVTMEKTPSYFWDEAVARNISEMMPPDTKFIVVVRDPVVRSVSHWIHLGLKIDTFKKGTFSKHPLRPGEPPLCYLNSTFEQSVLRPNGKLMDNNCVIRHSQYTDFLQFWLALFARDRFLVLDGDEFIADPLPALRRLETFIGLPRYFDETRVAYNSEKGFYCLGGLKPKAACMSAGKGRQHPEVDEDVLELLRAHFRPYNKKLEEMIGHKFSWS